MEGLALPPSPRWLTLHQLAPVSKPGHFLFVWRNELSAPSFNCSWGAPRWLRPWQITALDPAMNRTTCPGQKPWRAALWRPRLGRNFARDTSHRINYRLSCVSYWEKFFNVPTPAILIAGRVGRMRCGLLTTNRGVSLKFRSTS